MAAPEAVQRLVERFAGNIAGYRSPLYNETQVRIEFIDPFFSALGWDMANIGGVGEQFKDVVHEDKLRVEGGAKAPDYSFRVGGVRKFFLEAKRPSVNVEVDPLPALQVRRYAWSAKLPVSVLTDFEGLAMYDCRYQPKPEEDTAATARVLFISYEDYDEQWELIARLLSREAVAAGSLDAWIEEQAGRRGTDEVDRAFLREIDAWRAELAQDLAQRNPELQARQLNFAVQQTIDRIIFLRICEDRGIESFGELRALLEADNVYEELFKLFRQADQRFNSGLFHFEDEPGRAEAPDRLTPTLAVGGEVLKRIIRRLYYPESPYEFSVLPADILGQVYERFLGKVIRLTDRHEAVVEEKPEVRKAGGVYYTPTFIVDYIVKQTVGRLVQEKTARQVGGEGGRGAVPLRVLDPACGSGSFLIGAYQYLLDWYRGWYSANDADSWRGGRSPRLYETGDGELRLTTNERRRILRRHIFGVDIDPQAVEVTKLSLLLKLLEGESEETIDAQLGLFHERALPDLGANVKSGNSLIAGDFYEMFQDALFDEETTVRINTFDWCEEFPDTMTAEVPGFHAIIGNPPYVLIQDDFRDEQQLAYFREKYKVAAYKVDTYHVFMERGLQLLRPGGYFSMITPTNFLTNNNLVALRRLLLERSRIDHLLVISGGVFEGIAVDNAIFVLEGGRATASPFDVVQAEAIGQALFETRRSQVDPVRILESEYALLTGSADEALTTLFQRVYEAGVPLGEIAYVNFGKQLRDLRHHPEDVLEVRSLTEVPDGYRPCYNGRDVTRFHVEWSGSACSDDRAVKRGGCWDSARQDAANKLLTRQIGKFPTFAIDQDGFQCRNVMFMVNLKDQLGLDPWFVLGVLNSELIRYIWLDRYYDQRETFPKIKGTYLKELPIVDPRTAGEEQQAIVTRIAQVAESLTDLYGAARKERDPQAEMLIRRRIAASERELNAKVYELYGLDADDVQLLEGQSDVEVLLEASLELAAAAAE
jgi:type I restriction-modification system DNA methylase subunit